MQKSKGSPQYFSLLAWLKNARIKKNLSMRDLGGLLGEHHSVIGKVENCDRRLDVFEYTQYCQALGLDPSEGVGILTSQIDGQRTQ